MLVYSTRVSCKIRFGNFLGLGSFQEPENPKTELGKCKLEVKSSSRHNLVVLRVPVGFCRFCRSSHLWYNKKNAIQNPNVQRNPMEIR